MKSKKRLILELGTRLIKICQLRILKRKRVIERLEVFEFARDVTLRDIEDIFLKFSATRYEEVLFSLPRAFFLIRFLQLPSQNMEELRKMLPFQLAKIVPYPLEEVVWDFSPLKTEEGSSQVILFLVQEKKMQPLLEFTRKSKITPSAITIGSQGLNNWLAFQENFFAEEIKWPIALIDIDKYCADFLVADRGAIIFSRSFPYSQDTELLEGISQSLKIFENKFGKREFSKIVFTGNRKEDVFGRVNLGEFIFVDYGEHFLIEETPQNAAFSFASILGLTTDRGLSRYDFSPESIKQRRRLIRKKKRYLEIALVAGEVILICTALLFRYMFDRFSYSEFLNSKMEEIRVEAKELDEISDKLRILDKEFIRGKSLFCRILHKVFSSIPSNTQLTLLDFQENGDFSLKGYTEDDSNVLAMATSLNDSDLFEMVKIKYASKIKRKDKTMVEFYIYGKRASHPDSSA